MANGKIVTKIVKRNQHEKLLEKLILRANSFVIFISPFWHHKGSTFPIYEIYNECIINALKRGVRFLFLCDAVDKSLIEEYYAELNDKYSNGIRVCAFGFNEGCGCHYPQSNVHAKIYMNEKECVITSKNISGLDSISLELGVYTNAKKLYDDVFDEVKSYIGSQTNDVINYFYAILPNELKQKIEDSCPRCGGKLIYKTGKYGDFWGCSNYPNCKFTKKIE